MSRSNKINTATAIKSTEPKPNTRGMGHTKITPPTFPPERAPAMNMRINPKNARVKPAMSNIMGMAGVPDGCGGPASPLHLTHVHVWGSMQRPHTLAPHREQT